MPELQVLPRAKFDPRYTWNAESVFPTPAAWSAEVDQLIAELPAVAGLSGRLAGGPASLADALAAIDAFKARVGRAAVYAGMGHAVDTADQAAAERYARASALDGQMQAAVAFVEPELLAIGRETLARWTEAEPRLADYGHYFDNLYRKQRHVRDVDIEELLGLVSHPFEGTYGTYAILSDADFRFAPAQADDGRKLEVTQGSLGAILAGPDRRARRTAWENYHDTHLAYRNTLANLLSTSVRQNVFEMRARRFESTLGMALFQDNVPAEVYHNLIATFQRHLPVWHRYWAVRRKALKVDTLHSYDIWAPLSASPPEISYEQAVAWISDGLRPLGQEYVDALRRGCLQDRWVDVYPNQGKRSGAFSSGRYGTFPFIVMSFADNVQDLGTLAHELGHSLHSYLTWESQPYINSDYSLFAAEVASNFHQAMVRAHLFSQDLAPDLEIALIEEAMANFHRYFLVMPTLARFELEVHERAERGEGMAADAMIDLMADLVAEGYGSEMALDRRRDGISWATFGHLYADYYVFQYATGISAANALANRILSGVPGAADDYLRFLRAGSSLYPIDALRLAGVDMTTPEPVEQAFQVLSGLIDRLEGLVG